MKRGLVAIAVAFVLALAAAVSTAGSTAPPVSISNYPDLINSQPGGIAVGSDGALWFTNTHNNTIGRITTGGSMSYFSDPTLNGPSAMASGPDGALWFTNSGNDSIGRITMNGTVTAYTDAKIVWPNDITAGPDGALWFTNMGNDTIGRITPNGLVTSYADPGIFGVRLITAGPDGALWFTNNFYTSTLGIGRISTTGVVTNFPGVVGGAQGITTGPDGALWFTEDAGSSGSIGRITTSGVMTHFSDPTIDHPRGITTGPDGALWYANGGDKPSSSIGRLTTAGVFSNYTDPTIYGPGAIATGPDGALWFTNGSNNSIGRIALITDTTAPVLSLPNNIVENAAGLTGATVSYNVAATDNADPHPTVVCSPPSGSMFPIGRTTVTCTATDASANSSYGSFTVTILASGFDFSPCTQGCKQHITINLDFVPNPTTDLTVDLFLNDTKIAGRVADNGTSGPIGVDTGRFVINERGSALSGYSKSIICTGETRPSTLAHALTITQNAQITCLITNKRP